MKENELEKSYDEKWKEKYPSLSETAYKIPHLAFFVGQKK